MRILVCLMLVGVALAGCTDAEPTTAAEPTEPPVPKATAETGVIRGVVVDATITPLLGAKVSVEGTGLSAETDENGFFGFGDLQPGFYFVAAKALGYESVRTQVAVEAGDDDPPIVRIQMEADPDGVPTHEELVWDGLLQCGTPNVAICGAIKQYTGQMADDEFDHMFDFSPGMTEIHTELVWKSTQELGSNFKFIHRTATPEVYAGGQYQNEFGRATGPSPLKLVLNATNVDAEIGLGSDQELIATVFSGSVPQDPVGVAGLTLEQRFTVYAHSFYGYRPPADWRFTDESLVPPPA